MRTHRALSVVLSVRGNKMATEILVVKGSVLDQRVDAIVNASNTAMRGGGGIDGATHRAAGPQLIEELMRVAPHGSKIAEPVITPAYLLPQKYILHVAGPFWSGGVNNEREQLEACYRNCLAKAEEHPEINSIAFCSISTGVYHFPLEEAAEIAINAARTHAAGSNLDRIAFSMWQPEEFEVFNMTLNLLRAL